MVEVEKNNFNEKVKQSKSYSKFIRRGALTAIATLGMSFNLANAITPMQRGNPNPNYINSPSASTNTATALENLKNLNSTLSNIKKPLTLSPMQSNASTSGFTPGTYTGVYGDPPIPTLSLSQIKQIGNEIVIGGHSFVKYNGNIFNGNGSINNPYRGGSPNWVFNVNNNGSITDSSAFYQFEGIGKSYFVFPVRVAISPGGLKTNGVNIPSNAVVLLRTAKPVGVVTFTNDTFNLYGNGNLVMLPLFSNQIHSYRGMNFISIGGGDGAYSDGSKYFPFKNNPNNVKWYGPGHYQFVGQHTSTSGLAWWENLETYSKVTSPEELNMYYAALFNKGINNSPMPKLPSDSSSIKININGTLYTRIQNNMFFNPAVPVGTVKNPYNGSFIKPGVYQINGLETPVINSNKEFYKSYFTLENISNNLLMPKLYPSGPSSPGILSPTPVK